MKNKLFMMVLMFLLVVVSFVVAEEGNETTINNEDNNDGLFNLDLQDKLTVSLLIVIFIIGVCVGVFISPLVGGVITALLGLFLVFNGFNPLFSIIIVIMGFLLVFTDEPLFKK